MAWGENPVQFVRVPQNQHVITAAVAEKNDSVCSRSSPMNSIGELAGGLIVTPATASATEVAAISRRVIATGA